MAQVRIGFRSGREVLVKVEDLSLTKNTNDNRVSSIKWTGGPGILFIALDEIDYVLEDRK